MSVFNFEKSRLKLDCRGVWFLSGERYFFS